LLIVLAFAGLSTTTTGMLFLATRGRLVWGR
jgi:hypothetical protein